MGSAGLGRSMTSMPAMSRCVLVSSLGLMGGSLAAALSKAGWRVLLHHRRPEVAQEAEQLGYGTAIDDLATATEQADCIVVCTPVNVISETVQQFAALPGSAVITDIGSTKALICEELDELARHGRFIGSHPMAGSHLQGLANARVDLFQGAHCAITPHGNCPSAAIDCISAMWQAVGCSVHRYLPEDHDQAVAEVSHLPHILSSAAAMALTDRGLPLAATGYRDTTRVAAGNAAIWREILLHNKEAVAYQLECSIADLQRLLNAVEGEDEGAVEAWLQEGCDAREKFDSHRSSRGNAP